MGFIQRVKVELKGGKRVNGVLYYVDNYYRDKGHALKRAEKLRNKGYLAQVQLEGVDKKGKSTWVVLKRHKKHPRLAGLVT